MLPSCNPAWNPELRLAFAEVLRTEYSNNNRERRPRRRPPINFVSSRSSSIQGLASEFDRIVGVHPHLQGSSSTRDPPLDIVFASLPETQSPTCQYCFAYKHDLKCTPGNRTFYIDDAQRTKLESLIVNGLCDFESLSLAVCNILSYKYGKQICNNPPFVLSYFGKIIEKYSCHNCDRQLLKVILTAVCVRYLKTLTSTFACQVAQNILANERILDTELVLLSVEILAELPHEIISKNVLMRCSQTLMVHYVLLLENVEARKIMRVALDHLQLATELDECSYFVPSNGLIASLAKYFAYDPQSVAVIVTNLTKNATIILSESSGLDPSDTLRMATSIYELFTERLFREQYSWKSSPLLVQKYINLIIDLNDILLRTYPILQRDWDRPIYDRNLVYLTIAVEFLNDPGEIWKTYRVILRHMSQFVKFRFHPRFTKELFKTFRQKLQEISESARRFVPIRVMNHKEQQNLDVCTVLEMKFKYKKITGLFRQTHQSRKLPEIEFIQDIFEVILTLLSKDVLGFFELSFLDELVNAGKLFEINNFGLISSIIEEILNQGLSCKQCIVYYTNIPETMFYILNHLHDHCRKCQPDYRTLKRVLDLLTLDDVGIHFDDTHYDITRRVVSVSYLLHDRKSIIEVMYPTGFDLLLRSLEESEDHLKSLFVIAQNFTKYLNEKLWSSLECPNKLNEPVHDYEDTKVFVLDDGVKIRAKTQHLSDHSEFFRALLHGNFAESALDEITIRDVTAFEFHFIVNFIELSGSKVNFNMDVRKHLNIIVLCDRLMLDDLCRCVVDSLRWHHATAETLPMLYQTSLFHDIPCLKMACIDFLLAGDLEPDVKMDLLLEFFRDFDRKVLLGDIREWIMLECRSAYPHMDASTHDEFVRPSEVQRTDWFEPEQIDCCMCIRPREKRRKRDWERYFLGNLYK